jgi:4,5-DOPA dioxygenase extradiol
MNSYFIGHGSPMNAIEINRYSKWLNQLGKSLNPKAVLVLSAHWLTEGTFIASHPHPPLIYDFYGFPDELYRVKYSPPGCPEIARQVLDLIPGSQLDPEYGLDHGAWSVLVHLFPKANVPVFQVSLDAKLGPNGWYQIGRLLRPLRRTGVMILASGNIVHNLGMYFRDGSAESYKLMEIFDNWVESNFHEKKYIDLAELKIPPDQDLIHGANLSIPTAEHYAPFSYFLGTHSDDDTAKTVFSEMEKSLSMRSFAFESPF